MARGDSNQVVYVDGDVPQLPLQLGQLLVDSSQIAPGVTNLQQCTSQNPLVYEPIQGGYPINAAEVSAGVAVYDYLYPPGWIERYHNPADGADYTNAVNAAFSVNQPVYIGSKTYGCHGIVQTHNFQHVYGIGAAALLKNADGDFLTSSGSDVLFWNFQLRNDNSFAGKGFVLSGNRVRVWLCGTFRMASSALESTGAQLNIVGTNGQWHTTDTANYEIVVGTPGTATLYHQLVNIYTSQAGGGIKFIDCGTHSVLGSQFGKLTVEGAGLPGTSGGQYSANRINGATSVGLSNSAFAANSFSADVTFEAGTSGHRFDRSNGLSSGVVLTDNSTLSVVEDGRLVPYQTYTPTWTAASVNPSLGDGTITAYFSKKGREVTAFITLVPGSTTTFGTGEWYFTLPAIPSTSMNCIGSAGMIDSGTATYAGYCVTLADGTSRIRVHANQAATSAVGATSPFTWTQGDQLRIAITFFTN